MNPDIAATRRLQRLERVLAGRRARLDARLARERAEVLHPAPMSGLQRYGYVAATLLALAAVSPTVLGFAWRRRRFVAATAMNEMRLRKLRKKFAKARRSVR